MTSGRARSSAGFETLGVRIAFDDFGTGYASLTYLKKFPLDRLKIDQSFVRELRVDSDDAAIVGSTITLAKQLGLSVIAEGIEDRATADLLAGMGCEEGQGYYFGRPMPAAEFEQRFLSQAAPPDARHPRDGAGRERGVAAARAVALSAPDRPRRSASSEPAGRCGHVLGSEPTKS